MALEYKFGGRDKVIKGHTYPIKRADLDRALEEAGVTNVERVSYISSKPSQEEDGQVIGIWMKGEASIAGTWMKRSPGLLVASVPVVASQEIKKLIEKQDILGKMARWLKELEEAENVRRDQDQLFRVFYREGKLVIKATE